MNNLYIFLSDYKNIIHNSKLYSLQLKITLELSYVMRFIKVHTAAKPILRAYGVDALTERCCRAWFSCIKHGYYSLKDDPREVCPKGLSLDYLDIDATVNAATTARELSEKCNVSHTTFVRKLKGVGKVSQLGNGFRTTCLQRIANNVSISASLCLHDNFKCTFWTGFLIVIRNGPFAIMLSAIFSGSVGGTDLLSNREKNFIKRG